MTTRGSLVRAALPALLAAACAHGGDATPEAAPGSVAEMVNAPAEPGVIRIAAGAKNEVKDERGRVWKADEHFQGGQAVEHGERLVLANARAALYRQSRVGVLGYKIPVDNGRYTVVLHFIEADRKITGKGQRVFSVDVEGRPVPEVDVWHLSSGWDVPLSYSSPIEVTDGAIDLAFKAKAGDPTLSGIEIVPSRAINAPLPGSGVKVVFDPSKFAGDEGALAGRCKSDDRSGIAVTGLEQNTGVPGPWALRLDYAVDTRLPYSNRAYVACSTKADLTGMKSVHVWVKPDGTERTAWIELETKDGTKGTFGFPLYGTTPRRLDVPLEHMGSDAQWWSRPDGPNLAAPLKSMRVVVDSAGQLGGGAVYLGAVWASTEPAQPVAGPPGRATRAVGDKLVIEDFEPYGTDTELRHRYQFTSHGGMSVFSLDQGNKAEGKQGLRVDYSLGKRDHSGLVMFEKLDLAPYNVMRLWVRGDGSKNVLRVFDASGGYYQALIPLDDTKGKIVELPYADWIGEPAQKQGVIELGFWVIKKSDTNSGTIYLDQIELAKDPAKPMEFAKAPAPAKLPNPPVRIDVGSPVDTKDGDGNLWLADVGYHWGNAKIYQPDEPIEYKGPLAPIFKTERYGMAGYSFAVKNGAYELRLHFGESWTGAQAPGRRVCTVTINGTPIRDVDIFAEAGALYEPVVRRIALDVTDGKFEIGFKDVTNHCKLDGIELLPPEADKPAKKGKKGAK